ncbi:hypothetical protein [Oenococcus oeni]|uniref:hypothetical protein n=1 Tax=Oenococcus oeni TaxID=1247 RepID=UPI001644CCC2|nr:hypothetical protein [Oenococcus oeni]
MTIVEAIKKAQKTTGTIAKDFDPTFVFQPTNDPECTKIFNLEDPNEPKFISNRWEPKLKDFLDTDWIVGKAITQSPLTVK